MAFLLVERAALFAELTTLHLAALETDLLRLIDRTAIYSLTTRPDEYLTDMVDGVQMLILQEADEIVNRHCRHAVLVLETAGEKLVRQAVADGADPLNIDGVNPAGLLELLIDVRDHVNKVWNFHEAPEEPFSTRPGPPPGSLHWDAVEQFNPGTLPEGELAVSGFWAQYAEALEQAGQVAPGSGPGPLHSAALEKVRAAGRAGAKPDVLVFYLLRTLYFVQKRSSLPSLDRQTGLGGRTEARSEDQYLVKSRDETGGSLVQMVNDGYLFQVSRGYFLDRFS